MTPTCHGCHDSSQVKLMRCSRCRSVYYCSTSCQKRDWVHHKPSCKPHKPEINSAEHLAEAVYLDLIPSHPQTCEDYGFNRAISPEEKSKLLSLYIGLIKIMDIPYQTVHDWRVRGVLVEEIKAAYYKIPEHARGRYFPWFLQNEHIIARAGQSLTSDELRNFSDAMVTRAWKFIGGDEKDSVKDIEAVIKRKSINDQSCFSLYKLLLPMWNPSPDIDFWIDFGFAACTSEREEGSLGGHYQNLITKCTFDEFCDAYRDNRLLSLFHSKGVYVNSTDQLRDLLSVKWRKSVWHLKQFVVQDNSATTVPAVKVDYGFINCNNASETRQLKKAYKDFFTNRGDPLALHEAAIQGNIYGFLSDKVQSVHGPQFQRLMKNFYPLPDPGF